MTLFSQRQSEPPARYSYALPDKVRARVMHTLQQHKNGWMSGGQYDFADLLQEVGEQALTKYGGLRASPYEAARTSHNPVIEHFAACRDKEALDFIEMCFRSRTMGFGDDARTAVEAINRIFEEEGVGYELTQPVMHDTGKPGRILGRLTGNTFRIEYPRVVKKGERTVNALAVKPTLEALSDSRLAVANAELLKAFEEERKGDDADAITSCGSAFESVLRTICTTKGWPFDPNKATCSVLVEICRDKGLFPPLYTEIFKLVGTLRNKLGDAHGKGPSPVHVAGREHAEHMIAVTCAHITFLARLAGF